MSLARGVGRAPTNAVTDLLAGLVPLAIGLGLAFVPLTLLSTSISDEENAGLASGLLNTRRSSAGASGRPLRRAWLHFRCSA